MNSSHPSGIEIYANALVAGAAMELYLTPKPGLVDLADTGSHPDLSVPHMERSLRFLPRYMDELIRSLSQGEDFAAQTEIGQGFERAMLASLGTNTHKGYIFLSGLLLVARWRSGTACERSLRAAVASLAGEFFMEKGETATNGGRARARYGAGGIVREAMEGLPSLFEEALPAYMEAFIMSGSPRTASYAMMGRLMQCLEDTTTLHRCGTLGLSRIRRDGRLIERMTGAGDDCTPFLRKINGEYIRMGLTMGGVADMLGLSFASLLASGQPAPVYPSAVSRAGHGCSNGPFPPGITGPASPPQAVCGPPAD
jgi:triphosphoribosyl-dephospho-CoA synthase